MSLDLDLNYLENNFKVDKSSNNRVYQFEEFRLDVAHLMLSRGGEDIPLVPKAVETLLVLVEQRGKILSKDELMNAIWTDSVVEESNLAQYLHILRKTLGKQQNGQAFIETLRRRGYRFNGDVEVLEASPADPAASNGSYRSNAQPAASDRAVANRRPSDGPRTVQVERRGNVLAVAGWKEPEAETQPVAIPGHMSSASGSDSKLPYKRLYPAVIIISIVLLGSASYFWWSSRSNSGQTTAKDGIIVLNLTDGEDVDSAAISPDGNFFAYATRDGSKSHLFVQQTGQAGRHEIIEPVDGQVSGISITPDSQFLYCVISETGSATTTLYRVPALGGVRTKILSNIAAWPSFSPDGSEIAFLRAENEGSVLVIASSDGSGQKNLATYLKKEGKGLYGGVAWSPDGKAIAYGVVDFKRPLVGGCTIMGIDPASGETRPLSPEAWDNCFRMAWTSDSKGLVFIGTKVDEAFSTRRDQVYYLSIPDGTARRLTNDGSRFDYRSLGVTDKDQIIAVPFNRLSQIWSMDIGGDARDVVQITSGFADGRGGIAPLNDGRVAYLTRNGDGFSIWTMNSDGSNRRQLTADPPAIEEVRSPADGSFFVFSAKKDTWNHLFRVNSDGGDLRQLTFGENQEVDSTISPDGKWIVYNSMVYSDGFVRSSLLRISSDGGEPMELSDAQCVTPHFSPDGTSVSCVSNDWNTISIMSIETGKILSTFQTEPNPILNVGARWTPDGKSLAYIVSSKLVGNILLQPIDGGAARSLTDFRSGDIYNFAFSSDGARLYLARGYQTKKVVLIKNFR